MSFARYTQCTSFQLDNEYQIYDVGSFKNVYLGTFRNGPRSNQRCVAKEFKDSSEQFVFDNELRVCRKALEIVERFNNMNVSPITLYLNMPSIAFSNTKGQMLLEPFIKNFEKFNSNTGWIGQDGTYYSDLMQAFSHFSYHSTGGNLFVCDLQGGTFNKGFALTDPVVMSHFPENYGPTDLGRDGINTFFAYHECDGNRFCQSHWRRPKYQAPVLNRRQGTSTVCRPKMQTSRYYG